MDTTCFIGIVEFDILEQNAHSSLSVLTENQSDCFPVGTDNRKTDDPAVQIYPNPTAGWINIITTTGMPLNETKLTAML